MDRNVTGIQAESGGILSRFRKRLSWKLLAMTGTGFLVLFICVAVMVDRATNTIIIQQAETLAEIINARVRAMRKMYTQNIVKKLQADLPTQVKGSIHYDKPGEIPLPAVFVKIVGEETDKINKSSTYSLVSDWNINPDKGIAPSDTDFNRVGWNFLKAQEEDLRKKAGTSKEEYGRLLKEYTDNNRWKSFSRVETVNGREVLRYIAADPAADKACVNCHNGLEQQPEILAQRKRQGLNGKVFQLNELMGALSVEVPLDKAGAVAGAQRNRLLILAGGLTAVILVLLGIFLSRSAARIRSLQEVTSRIIHDGDLTTTVKVTSEDEVGQLASSFDQMVRSLRELIRGSQDAAETLNQSTVTLTESAQTLGGAVTKLSSATNEQTQTVTRQAASLQETQVTAQEIKQTSVMASQKAEDVLKVTERADEVSRVGSESLDKSIGGLNDVRNQAEEIARKIAELTERTRRISGITDTVKGLADQSNMLALNAAIEAVRSGEHGKGFAVVAREIRNLADQSIQATNQVQEILSDIGSAIDQAVTITQRGAQKMEGGLTQVKQSGGNLRELSTIVRDNSLAVRQIAAAVSQQNAGITQIFSAVGDQTKMMDETVKRLESTKQAAGVVGNVSQRVLDVSRRMSDISKTVSELVRRYRV